jgi:hypothetical protein
MTMNEALLACIDDKDCYAVVFNGELLATCTN